MYIFFDGKNYIYIFLKNIYKERDMKKYEYNNTNICVFLDIAYLVNDKDFFDNG